MQARDIVDLRRNRGSPLDDSDLSPAAILGSIQLPHWIRAN